MTLEEAYEVAKLVDADPRVQLVAIGRFVPLAELDKAREWGVSIKGDGMLCHTLWSPIEWTSYRAKLPKLVRSKKPVPAAKVPALAHSEQPTLF